MPNEELRTFKFYMSDPETGGYYSSETKVPDHYPEFEDEIDYLLEQFKNFLKLVGYGETTVSRLQYLEDNEWKYVLTNYHEWDEPHERVFMAGKREKY